MKRIAIAVVLVVLIPALNAQAQSSAQPKSENAEQELIKLETDWTAAMVKADVAFLDRILADDYLFTDPDGVVSTKAQMLAEYKSRERVMSSAVTDNLKVRVYGDAAVVMGRNTEKGQYKGQDISGQFQWTDTWIKHAGRWRCVAGHGSKISQK